DAGAAAGHDGEPGPGESGAEVAGHPVVTVVLVEAGRAEDGHARADEVQRPEPGDQLPEDAQRPGQFEPARLRPLQEALDLRDGLARVLLPAGALGRRPGRVRPHGFAHRESSIARLVAYRREVLGEPPVQALLPCPLFKELQDGIVAATTLGRV